MPPNPMKASGWLLALGVLSIAACGQSLTDSAGRASRIVLDFGSILGGDFVSVLDTAYLTITAGGDERTLTRLFGAGDSETTFDVKVKSGPVTFSIDVVSDSGESLYRGVTTATIDADGFAVAITPQAVNAVMVVYPGRATFAQDSVSRSFTDTLRVHNAGSAVLTWRLDSLVPRPQAVAFSCRVLPGQDDNCLTSLTLPADSDAIILVMFGLSDKTAFQPPQTLKFLSTIGSVTTKP